MENFIFCTVMSQITLIAKNRTLIESRLTVSFKYFGSQKYCATEIIGNSKAFKPHTVKTSRKKA